MHNFVRKEELVINPRQGNVTISIGEATLEYTSTSAAITATLWIHLVMELHIIVLQTDSTVINVESITQKEMENCKTHLAVEVVRDKIEYLGDVRIG
jgi:hypothetical protein